MIVKKWKVRTTFEVVLGSILTAINLHHKLREVVLEDGLVEEVIHARLDSFVSKALLRVG